MKAVIYDKYGPPEMLKIGEVELPGIRDDSVLIKINYTTVTAADTLMRRADSIMARLLLGFMKPRKTVLGTEFSGAVEKVGDKVTRVNAGDHVYGFTGFNLGAYAEYCALKEKASFVKMPESISFKDAVCLADGATTAMYFLKNKARIAKNDDVLIIGASGSIGTYAVQIAKCFGANVTGVCGTKNAGLVKQLGAGEVIDYTKDNYLDQNKVYDIVFDCIGNTTFNKCKNILKEGGKYITTKGGIQEYLGMLIMNKFRNKKVIAGMSINKVCELNLLNDLWRSGEITTIIDKEYPVEQIVQAHRYVETGHKKGNVVIKL